MSLDNLVGQTLAQYQLRELLGVGGMGAVYRAYQTNLKREVAVKIISPQLLTNTEAMARFIREAEVSAQLEHSNIVPIYDFGTQRGITYVVMRMLTGGSLSRRIEQRIEDGRSLISLGETADLLKQVASALDYAHSHGVVHRDIKPANIMFDNQGKPYVVDFGIAKITQGATSFTQTGMAMGTPNYMPPEQWRGEQPTPMADQYALAVMTYQLIAGRMPFEADSAFALMHKHINEQPTPLHVFRPDIPASVMLVLNRAMAKDYRQRFQSCTAFAQAFESAIEGNKGNITGMFLFPVRPSQTGAIPISNRPYTPSNMPFSTQTKSNSKNWLVGGFVLTFMAVLIFIGILLAGNNGDSADSSSDATATVGAIVMIITETPEISPTPFPPEITDTPLEIATETPALDSRSIAQTLVAEENNATATSQALTATIGAELTLIRQEQQIVSDTATASVWTETPSPTLTSTSSDTPTATHTPSVTPTRTPTSTRTATYTPITPTIVSTRTTSISSTFTAIPTTTLDAESRTLLAPFTATARAQLPPLVGDFTITQTSPTDLNIGVTASVSGGTGNYTYSWDFGDTTTADGQSANHTYAIAGTYAITLTIGDGVNSAILVKDLTINSLPTATLDTEAMALVYTATARANLPPSTPTAYAQTNLLVDPGFENGVFNVVADRTGSEGVLCTVPADWGGWFTETPRTADWQNRVPTCTGNTDKGNSLVRSGNRSHEFSRSDATFTAAIYQTVAVPAVGTNVIGQAYYVMDVGTGSTAQVRVGIDPNGGTNPFDSDVVWSSWGGVRRNTDGFGPLTVNATSTGTSVTLFIYTTQAMPTNPNKVLIDDASLTVDGGGGAVAIGTPLVTFTPTVQPVPPEANVTVNVASANLRSGPGTNYGTVASASNGTAFRVIARTSDSQWYLIELSSGERAWISASVVTVSLANSRITVAATIPAAPVTSTDSETTTTNNTDFQLGDIRYDVTGCWASGTILRLNNTRGEGVSARIIPNGEAIEWVATPPIGYSTGNGAEVYRQYETTFYWEKWCEVRLISGNIGWLQYNYIWPNT